MIHGFIDPILWFYVFFVHQFNWPEEGAARLGGWGLGGLGRFGSRFLWSVTNLSGMHPIGVGVLTHV